MKKVVIGIQQRLKSTRLPYKASKIIRGKTVTQLVVDQALKCSKYLNRHSHRNNITTSVHLLIPEDDLNIIQGLVDKIDIITGHETDVLSRYYKLYIAEKPDYIVRITGDCPLIPSPIITKVINTVINGDYDFVSNADPNFRTFWDGADCEIMSAKALEYLNKHAKNSDREHVTSLLYRDRPKWCNYAHIFSELDMTDKKLSIDTEEDFERVKALYESVENKIEKWIKANGKTTCHRY